MLAHHATGPPGQQPFLTSDERAKHALQSSVAWPKSAFAAALACTAAGSPETVRKVLEDFVSRYEPDEIIITGQIHDHAARLKSFRIAAEILSERAAAPSS